MEGGGVPPFSVKKKSMKNWLKNGVFWAKIAVFGEKISVFGNGSSVEGVHLDELNCVLFQGNFYLQ